MGANEIRVGVISIRRKVAIAIVWSAILQRRLPRLEKREFLCITRREMNRGF